MNSIEMINRLPPPSASRPGSATRGTQASDVGLPTVGERFDEILPLFDFIPEAGPPVIFVLGPWLLLVLMLIGPFVLLVTLVLVAAVFLAIAAAMFLLPYLLLKHLRTSWPHRRARHTSVRRLRGLISNVTSNGL